MRSLILLPVFALLITTGISEAQMQDSMAYRRNVVKLNFSSRALYNSTYVFSYERVMKNNQSFAVTGGYMELPSMRLRYSVRIDREISKSGFTFGGEYRFYLLRENRYAAPRGVFIGPYASVHSFENIRQLQATASLNQATFESGITLTSIGFQVGYQFVLNNRWTIDIVFFGPSMTHYNIDLKLNGNFTPEEEDAIIDAVEDSFPVVGNLLEGISVNGKTSTWYAGYRYTMQVGYRFGSKKNKGK